MKNIHFFEALLILVFISAQPSCSRKTDIDLQIPQIVPDQSGELEITEPEFRPTGVPTGWPTNGPYGPGGDIDPTPPPTDPNGPSICDPFGSGDPPSSGMGLYGYLSYLPNAEPMNANLTSGIDDALSKSTKLDNPIFFADLNIPSRLFSEGFPTTTGSVLLDDSGKPLISHFVFQLETELQLSTLDATGYYQIAFIVDDAARVDINETGSGFHRLLSTYDEIHGSWLVCSSRAIQFSTGVRVPAKIDYHQGPGTEVALLMLWRQVSDPTAARDEFCEKQTDDIDKYFDTSVTPSAPKANYTKLLSRGWKVLKPENFALPANAPTNPCAE